MISKEHLRTIDKNAIPNIAVALDSAEIENLVALLEEKEDAVRYPALLLLQQRSAAADDVFPFWETFVQKLSDKNSYQRSIGLMLLAENAKWDTTGKTKAALPDYLARLQDEKPVTVRQCIQNLEKIIAAHPDLGKTVASTLTALDLEAVRESMRKLVLTDILNVLLKIRDTNRDEAIDPYILSALSGAILDEKSKKAFRRRFDEQNT
jgi:hypothetical protein